MIRSRGNARRSSHGGTETQNTGRSGVAWLQVNHNHCPHRAFYVSGASKGVSIRVSLLFATLAGRRVNVVDKRLTGSRGRGRLKAKNCRLRCPGRPGLDAERRDRAETGKRTDEDGERRTRGKIAWK